MKILYCQATRTGSQLVLNQLMPNRYSNSKRRRPLYQICDSSITPTLQFQARMKSANPQKSRRGLLCQCQR